MRLKHAAPILFIVGNLVAAQAFAGDVSPQPLTRADCDKAAMAWDTNANVCVANSGILGQPLTRSDCDKAGMSWKDNVHVCMATSQQAGTQPEAEAAANSLGQPLTRKECDLADMKWDNNANVCGGISRRSATQDVPLTINPVASTILINIDKATQQMTVFFDGVEKYRWAVSTGKRGYSTPSGSYTATSMNEIWYSKQWDNAPMPHAIFFMKDGHAIHGSYEVKHLGKAASHGCVRIAPQNAAILYDAVKRNGMENTQVVVSGETLGGEGTVASSARSRARYGQGAPRKNYYADSYVQPSRRGGFFRRLFGGR